jgi:hypothetical protein
MMNVLLSLSAAAVFAWGAAPASGQADEDKHPPSEVPIDRTPKSLTAEVSLRYYWKAGERPAKLKVALEQLKPVSKVELPPNTRVAVVTYTGRCNAYTALETAAHNAGFPALVLSHVHVVAVLKPLKGGDTKNAAAEIARVAGVHDMTAGESALVLHADLEKLVMENLKSAAAKYNCDIVVNQTYEYARFKVVEGDPAEYLAAADVIKGVLVIEDEGEGVVGMWINKSHVKIDRLEKLPGFKAEKQ